MSDFLSMKVLAIKGIEDMGSRWGVRYTRHHGKSVQDAYFLCDTLDKAKEKFRELLDDFSTGHF